MPPTCEHAMRLLLVNQAFHPDVAATAQYAADLAQELARAGHQVTIVAGRRGYDDPTLVFAAKETWRGIDIVRVGATGLGKSAPWRRAIDFGTFWLACLFRLLWLPRFDVVVALTSPPLISVAAAAIARLRRSRFVAWVMDLNPDQAVAAGWLRQNSLSHRLLDFLVGTGLRSAALVVVLDRFMRERVEAKGISPERIAVVPPWSRDAAVEFDPEGRARFRSRYHLRDKFVVMYSGNHSPCHPLDTALEAALRLRGRPEVVFLFSGGGVEMPKVERFAREHALGNILRLPYQPQSDLAATLSAADLHLVVMGDAFRGIVHPCKVYGILAVGAPCLYIGPDHTHVTDLAADADIRVARHGDADAVAGHILDSLSRGASRSEANLFAARRFAQKDLCSQLALLMAAAEGGVEAPVHPPLAAAAAAGASDQGVNPWNRS